MPNKIYCASGRGLGDCWATVNYLFNKSLELREEVVVSSWYYNRRKKKRDVNYKLNEIISLIDCDGKISVTDDEGDRYLSWKEVFSSPYLPSKIKWTPNDSKVFCYQFDGKSHKCKNLPPKDEELVLKTMKDEGYETIRLGKHLSLKECLEIMSHSELFLGVDSGMMHVAHSSGVPTYIARNLRLAEHIEESHKGKTYVLCENANDFLEKFSTYLGGSFLRNTEVYEYLCEQKETDLNDITFWERFIKNKIGIFLNAKRLGIDHYHFAGSWGGLQCKQYPNELAQFMSWVFENKDQINSYMEIGVERGGLFFLMDSLLRASNKHFSHSFGIDLSSKIIKKHNFRGYNQMFPSCVFEQIDSRNLKPEGEYDLCFIDGGHTYKNVKTDFELMKNRSRFIALHDIFSPFGGGGVKRLWDEIKNKYSHREFKDTNPQLKIPVGIGVIDSEGKQ